MKRQEAYDIIHQVFVTLFSDTSRNDPAAFAQYMEMLNVPARLDMIAVEVFVQGDNLTDKISKYELDICRTCLRSLKLNGVWYTNELFL